MGSNFNFFILLLSRVQIYFYNFQRISFVIMFFTIFLGLGSIAILQSNVSNLVYKTSYSAFIVRLLFFYTRRGGLCLKGFSLSSLPLVLITFFLLLYSIYLSILLSFLTLFLIFFAIYLILSSKNNGSNNCFGLASVIGLIYAVLYKDRRAQFYGIESLDKLYSLFLTQLTLFIVYVSIFLFLGLLFETF